MPLLKIDPNDPDQERKELEFTVKCALERDPSERLDRWLEWNIQMLKWVEELHGYKESPPIVEHS